MDSQQDPIFEAIEQLVSECAAMRRDQAVTIATLTSYNNGRQWIPSGALPYTTAYVNNPGYNRLNSNYNPEAFDIRVSDNVFTRFVIKAAASTFPDKIEGQVLPGERDIDAYSIDEAQVAEDLLNTLLDGSGYLEARRQANYSRCLCGPWGVGLRMRRDPQKATIDGQDYAGNSIRYTAFEFDMTRLSLDPANKSRDLRDHDEVLFSDVFTLKAMKDVLGIDIAEYGLKPDDFPEIGQLTPVEQNLFSWTGGSVYAQYARFSKSKGALIHELYRRSPSGRFDFYALVMDGPKGKVFVNKKNPVSGFGGDGLPFGLYHGHRRTETILGASDGWMIKEGQDKRNLLLTLSYRHLRKMAGFQYFVDKRWFGGGRTVNDDEIKNQLTNQVGGIVIGSGSSDKTVMPPQIVQQPPPQPMVVDMTADTERSMRENVFRAEGNFGSIKSHTTASSFDRAIEEADQVFGTRVQEDLRTDQQLLTVMLGCGIRAIQSGSMATLAALRRKGFTDDDFGVIVNMDPTDPPGSVVVREGTARYRGYRQREQQLMAAAQVQAIGPEELRMAMADDLDSPAMDADRRTLKQLRRMVSETVAGIPWEPMPLGRYTGWAIDLLQQQLVSPLVRKDPSARQRVIEAIMSQQAASSPPQAAQPQQPPPETVGSLLDQMSMQAQPAA